MYCLDCKRCALSILRALIKNSCRRIWQYSNKQTVVTVKQAYSTSRHRLTIFSHYLVRLSDWEQEFAPFPPVECGLLPATRLVIDPRWATASVSSSCVRIFLLLNDERLSKPKLAIQLPEKIHLIHSWPYLVIYSYAFAVYVHQKTASVAWESMNECILLGKSFVGLLHWWWLNLVQRAPNNQVIA